MSRYFGFVHKPFKSFKQVEKQKINKSFTPELKGIIKENMLHIEVKYQSATQGTISREP